MGSNQWLGTHCDSCNPKEKLLDNIKEGWRRVKQYKGRMKVGCYGDEKGFPVFGMQWVRWLKESKDTISKGMTWLKQICM